MRGQRGPSRVELTRGQGLLGGAHGAQGGYQLGQTRLLLVRGDLIQPCQLSARATPANLGAPLGRESAVALQRGLELAGRSALGQGLHDFFHLALLSLPGMRVLAALDGLPERGQGRLVDGQAAKVIQELARAFAIAPVDRRANLGQLCTSW